MRYYGSAANVFTYPFITKLVEVKFGYPATYPATNAKRINDPVRPDALNYFSLSIALSSLMLLFRVNCD